MMEELRMKGIPVNAEEKIKKSDELFAKLNEVQKRHLEIHQKYYAGKTSDEEVIGANKELSDTLEEWRSSLFPILTRKE
jgi:hypothetical protein